MKKTLLSVFITILSVVFVNAQDLSLKDVLNKHFEAGAQEKLCKVKTIKMTGKQLAQGMEFPFTVYIKRPGKAKIEADVQGSKFVQAYNGTSAYTIMPWTGSLEPQDMNEDQLKDMKDMADIDGKFFDYEKKGSKLELIGTEDMEGTKVYKLKLTEKPEKAGAEGDVSSYYIDAESFLILKTATTKNMGGNSIEILNYTSNYKLVDGIPMPYSMESKAMGNTMSTITVETITFNEDVADDLFEKPAK